jgi:hypothetical protein
VCIPTNHRLAGEDEAEQAALGAEAGVVLTKIADTLEWCSASGWSCISRRPALTSRQMNQRLKLAFQMCRFNLHTVQTNRSSIFKGECLMA